MKKGVHKAQQGNGSTLIPINVLCWIVIPLVIIGMLLLDRLGFYIFNAERMIVLGVLVFVLLIPFFSEITIHNVSIKKEKQGK